MSDLTPHYNIEHYHFRQQWMLLGLPFDAVTLDQACDRVFEAIEKRQRCFISTPNLNFVINAKRDPEFAKSVFLSDLNLADGMPLVWAARWLKIPIPERVAGSSLFDELVKKSSPNKPLRVFFFGGDPGVAEKASAVLNDRSDAVVCCGYHDPGRGDVASMSTPEVIAKINAANADFLVVSLGAKKGQAWILHNLEHLTVPAVSHLGAVVNFVAGTVKRAPKIWQTLGLEWLWRIVEEPYLWKRYATDGLAALKMASGLFKQRFTHSFNVATKAECFSDTDNKIKIILSGRPTATQLETLYNGLNLRLQTVENNVTMIELLLNQADLNCPELQAFIQIIEVTTQASGIHLSQKIS